MLLPLARRRLGLSLRLAPRHAGRAMRSVSDAALRASSPEAFSPPRNPEAMQPRLAGVELALPTEEGLQQARGEAEIRSEARRLQGLAESADMQQLYEVMEDLMKIPSSSSSSPILHHDARPGPVGIAWDAVAARTIELSRLGKMRTASAWVQALGAFAQAGYWNPALLTEAEDVLTDAPRGGNAVGLIASAEAEEVVALVGDMDKLHAPCSASLLGQCVTRLNALQHDLLKGCVRRFSAFVGAFARARLYHDELYALVKQALSTTVIEAQLSELPPAERDATLSDLALFCRTFGGELFANESAARFQLEERLVDELAVSALRASVEHLAELLPLLAAWRHSSHRADDAFRDVVRVRLPGILAPGFPHKLSAKEASQLLEALAIGRERHASTLMSLTKECHRVATSLDARSLISVASSLAHLGLRQEQLMVELADNLLVRHRHTLADPGSALAIQRAWTRLRVPHEALFAAIADSAGADGTSPAGVAQGLGR